MDFLKSIAKAYGEEFDKAGELVMIPATLFVSLAVAVAISGAGQ